MEHTGNENISLQNKWSSTALDQVQVQKQLSHDISTLPIWFKIVSSDTGRLAFALDF